MFFKPRTTNYARHAGIYVRERATDESGKRCWRSREIVPARGEIVFFGDVIPARFVGGHENLDEWTFYRAPEGLEGSTLRLIGVSNI